MCLALSGCERESYASLSFESTVSGGGRMRKRGEDGKPPRSRWRRGAALAAALAAAMALGSPRAPAAEAPLTGDVSVTLSGGLPKTLSAAQPPVLCDLVLDFAVRDGRWGGEVWGYSHAYNRADHAGTVLAAAEGPNVRLEVTLQVEGDGWVGGGPASYVIDLERSGERLAGTFRGTFRGAPVAGAAAATVRPPWPAPVKGVGPAGPGEHPRLAFRRGDVAVLRERMKTPEGRAVIANLRAILAQDQKGFGWGVWRQGGAIEAGQGHWAAGHAFLWQLTGDRAEADRARELLEQALVAVTAQDETWLYALLAEGVALAYDLCYDAWDEAFRRQVASHLERIAWTWTHEPRDWRPQDMTTAWRDLNPYGAELVLFRAAAGDCAMAVLGDVVAYPNADARLYEPSHEPRWLPHKGLLLDLPGPYPNPDVLRIGPPPGYEPGRDVPAVPLADDEPIVRWLAASVPESPEWRPFDAAKDRDPLQSLGGGAAVRPEAGTRFKYLDAEGRFEPLPQDRIFADAYTDFRPSVNLLRQEHYDRQTLDLYYTVLDNDRPRFVKLHLGQRYLWWPKVWVGGVPVRDREVVHLGAGRIPVLIQVRVPTQQTYYPYFPALYGQTDRSGKVVRTRGRRAQWHYNWTVLQDVPIRPLPETDFWMTPRFAEADDPKAAWEAGLAAWKASGERSVTAPRGLKIALRTIRRYLDGYMGEHGWLVGNSDLDEASEVLLAFAHHARTALGWDLAAGPGEGLGWTPLLAMADGMSRWRNDRGPGTLWLPVGFSLVPGPYRGAVSWFCAREGAFYEQRLGHTPIYVFVNQPWATPPEPPDGRLPLALEDKKLGGFVFRNGWDAKACYALLESARLPNRACALGGEFAVYGFGVPWVRRSYFGGGTAYYFNQGATNSVTIERTWPVGGAEVKHAALGPDGSGVVSLAMDRLFWGGEPREVSAAPSGPPRGAWGWGIDWGDGGPEDLGIRAVRSFAADYGGKSGAKALYAVADRFTGAGDRAKTWRATITGRTILSEPAQPDPKGAPLVASSNVVRLGGEGAGTATMQMTFLAAEDVRPVIAAGYQFLEVRAETKGDGFLVIMTLQEGDPPPLKVEGAGADATVTVGGRTVRFDGEKIVLGE